MQHWRHMDGSRQMAARRGDVARRTRQVLRTTYSSHVDVQRPSFRIALAVRWRLTSKHGRMHHAHLLFCHHHGNHVWRRVFRRWMDVLLVSFDLLSTTCVPWCGLVRRWRNALFFGFVRFPPNPQEWSLLTFLPCFLRSWRFIWLTRNNNDHCTSTMAACTCHSRK